MRCIVGEHEQVVLRIYRQHGSYVYTTCLQCIYAQCTIEYIYASAVSAMRRAVFHSRVRSSLFSLQWFQSSSGSIQNIHVHQNHCKIYL